MDNFMIGILILLIAMFIGRTINQKANKNLSADKKVELIDLFSKNGIYRFGILIVILVFYFGNIKFEWINFKVANIIYIILILVFLLGNGYVAYKKLKDYDFPDNYIKMYLFSSLIRFLGLIVFFALLDFY